MIARAIVASIVDKYHVKVRIPQINKSSNAQGATPDSELYTAIISATPGTMPALKVGSVVLCSFENGDNTDPVILGLLYNEKSKSTTSDTDFSSLNVQVHAQLPKDTSIGNVSSTSLSYLYGLNDNLQSQLDTLVTKLSVIEAKVQGMDVLIPEFNMLNYYPVGSIYLSTTGIDLTKAHHVVFVSDGNGVKVYVDGALTGSSGYIQTASEFLPGSMWLTNMSHIIRFRVFTSALSDVDVAALYAEYPSTSNDTSTPFTTTAAAIDVNYSNKTITDSRGAITYVGDASNATYVEDMSSYGAYVTALDTSTVSGLDYRGAGVPITDGFTMEYYGVFTGGQFLGGGYWSAKANDDGTFGAWETLVGGPSYTASINNTNPSTFIGGMWSFIEGASLLVKGENLEVYAWKRMS